MKGGRAWLMAGVLAGCAGQPTVEAPPWVNGEPEAYPPDRYMIGRGAGETAAQARDRARADLAKVFGVEIEAHSHDVQTSIRSGGQEDSEQRSIATVKRQVVTHTRRLLEGTEIADTWQDPQTGGHHALAVMAKHRAREQLRQQIEHLDTVTRQTVARARASEAPLARIGAARQALGAQRERMELQRALQAIDVSGRGIPAPWSLAELESDLEQLLGRLVIKPEAEGQLSALLTAALTDAGFMVNQAQGDYTVAARAQLDSPVRREGWYWVRGQLTVTLRDPQGTEQGVHRWPIKASAQEPQVAERRAWDQVAQTLDEELQAALIDFASTPSH